MPRSASRAVLVGLVLFAIGVVFIAVDVLPFFDHDKNTPLWLNLACLLAPVGFAVAIGSAVRAGNRQQKQAARAVAAATQEAGADSIH